MYNILLIKASLDSGGVSRVTYNLADEMSKRGHRVSILTFVRGGVEKKASFNSYQMYDLGFSAINIFSLLKSVILIRTFLKRHRDYDLIVSAGNIISMPVAISYRLLKYKGKLIVNSHTNVKYYAREQSFIKKLLTKCCRFTHPLADVIATVSHSAAKDSAEYLGLKKVVCLYNPFVPPEITKSTHVHAWFQEDVRVIVACGRLVKQKGFAIMIRAFAQVSAVKPGLKLLILGDGEDLPHLEVLVEELDLQHKVDFPGYVQDPQNYMCQAECVWVSSHYEGFCLSILESLSVGTPVVSVDCPSGPREILQDGKYGMLVPDNHVDSHVKAMLTFLDQPKKERQFYQERAKSFDAYKMTKAYFDAVNLSF